MNIFKLLSCCIVMAVGMASALHGQDPLADILQAELEREMKGLSSEPHPPYYIDYRVDDLSTVNVSASFGSLTGDYAGRARILTATVKIGDYAFDNTHEFKNVFSGAPRSSVYSAQIPLENVSEAIAQELWQATDQAYKNALSTYSSLLDKRNEMEEDTSLADFSREEPNVYYEPPLENNIDSLDTDYWKDLLQNITARYKEDTSIFHSDAAMAWVSGRKYFISTEGSRIVQNVMYAQLQIMLSIRHKGGSILPLNKSYTAFHPDSLPDETQIRKDIGDLYNKLAVLRDAPMAEAYAGPAILSPGAAGVFFHEIFGHRIEGHRLESFTDGQTFKEKIGDKVLPKGFHVYSDPTLHSFEGQDLIGYYKYDEQGIEAEKVEVVRNGELVNFLMSRRPTKEFSNSTGHGRAQAGNAPVSRQSNLIIDYEDGVTMEDLRKKLIRECKRQNKEYGYYFKEVIGGLTVTDRYNTNVFNITPIEVYRIYVDGRPDELVSGVELIGTPLTMFSNIVAASDVREVFTGFCGAESGHIPVTAIAPALFVKKIETQKTPEFNSKMPVLPPPEIEYWNREKTEEKE